MGCAFLCFQLLERSDALCCDSTYWHWVVISEAVFAREGKESPYGCNSIQVIANIASVVIGEAGLSDKNWITWTQLFLLVDVVCCCAVLFPIVWSIKHLREAARTDGKAAKNLVKLTLFRQYYVVVVAYIYFTRIVVFALQTVTSYHYTWVSELARETATLAFYIFTGYKFRPVPHNPYFVLDEEEEEAALEALKDDEFEL